MKTPVVAVIGSGPYGLSLAAHLLARNIDHRIFGEPMAFWHQIARAGPRRFLKSYCFGTNISAPGPGSRFADYNEPRGLETFEPCSIENFVAYGLWFQQKHVDRVEPLQVVQVERPSQDFLLTLSNGERFVASDVIVATGLANFARIPAALSGPPGTLTMHSSAVEDFAAFKGLEVAVVGAGQSALEAAALLHEAGASARLVIRKPEIRWMTQGRPKRNLWHRLRSPISALGSGPRAWALTHAPPLIHHLPDCWRAHILKTYLPPEGAWWLRERVDGLVPVHTETTVLDSRETGNRVALRLRSRNEKKDRQLTVDRVIAGTGYEVSVERIPFLHPKVRRLIARHGSAPRLDGSFQSSVPGLRFVGPASAMSFGPLYRFVAGAEYTARTISNHLASRRGARA